MTLTKPATRWFEVILNYAGEDLTLAVHSTEAEARADWENGPSRIKKLIHGDTLRIDEVWYNESTSP